MPIQAGNSCTAYPAKRMRLMMRFVLLFQCILEAVLSALVQVFYGPRSLVFHESDNRKWSIMGAFE